MDQVVLVTPDWNALSADDGNDCPGCGGCATCGSGTVPTVCPITGCIDVTIGLGGTAYGKSAGQLKLKSEKPSAALSRPSALITMVSSDSVVINSAQGLRQVRVGQALGDVITNSQYSYDINFYHNSQVGGLSNGLYTTSGSPYATLTIENPNTTTNNNALRLTLEKDSATTVYDFVWSESDQDWELITGGGLRHDLRTKSWDAAHSNRTETVIIKNESGTTISKETSIVKVFPWGGEGMVTNIVDPDGAALTTAWNYLHGFRRYKQLQAPQAEDRTERALGNVFV